MGRPALALEKPPLLPENLAAPVWPGLPTYHISRDRFKTIGRNPKVPSPNFRVLSFNRLGYLYSVDTLGIREKILPEFGYTQNEYGSFEPSPTIAKIGITDESRADLKFGRDPYEGTGYCPPKQLDLLDVESMCNFTCDVMALVRQGRDYKEQRDILTWKAGVRTGPSMVEHWARASHVLIAAASNSPEIDK